MVPMDSFTIFHGVVDWLWLIDHAWFDRLCTLSKNTHSSIVCFCAAILSMHSFMHAIVETQYVSSDSIYWMSLRPQRGKYISKRQRIFYDKYNCHKLGALANPGIRREKEEIIKQLPTLCNFLCTIHTKSRVNNIVW